MIYRVRIKSTSSFQGRDDETHWNNKVIYCGKDREEAIVCYYASGPEDFLGGPGNRVRKTIIETLDENRVDDFDDMPEMD